MKNKNFSTSEKVKQSERLNISTLGLMKHKLFYAFCPPFESDDINLNLKEASPYYTDILNTNFTMDFVIKNI